MATFSRHVETHYGVQGEGLRVPDGAYRTELNAEMGAVAEQLGLVLGSDPSGLMGLPGDSDDPELTARREWGIWAPKLIAPRLISALKDRSHTVVDE